MGIHPPGTHPAVLIVSGQAREYADQISTRADIGIPYTACDCAEDAVACYRGEPIVLGEPQLIAAVIDDLAGVRWVQSTWAGVKPLLDIGKRPWLLTGVKGVFGPQMAEYVCGYLLAHELRLMQRAAHQHRREWFIEDSGALRGKRAGILGTGSIGSHIAKMLKAFGVVVAGLNRSGHPAAPFDQTFPATELGDFLKDLDYLVAALPETDSTCGLLDEQAFERLPNHAVLVNVGRGSVLDEPALVRALESGKLGGAVLDVFETEPLPPESPLWTVTGLTITAHVAARSRPADIVPLFLENYRRYIAGESLRFEIDFERGY